MDSKGPSDDEALTPPTAESDGSKEYAFTTGGQTYLSGQDNGHNNLNNDSFRGNGAHFEQEGL